MKKLAFIRITTTCLFITAVISCKTPAEKAEKAQENVVNANEKLDSAIVNYERDIDAYRLVTIKRIQDNEKSMNDFKLRIAKEKLKAKKEYEKKLTELEKKNTDLKKKMADYKAEGSEKWNSFKVEFNKEMDELSKSIKDLISKDKN